MAGNYEVIPSMLEVEDALTRSYPRFQVNTVLRVGRVIEVIYADDVRNIGKKVTQYTVLAEHRGGGTSVLQRYDNCVLLDQFGGVADHATWHLRQEMPVEQGAKPGIGSKVLLLCINGDRTNPVILGGIHDDQETTQVKDVAKKKGHYFDWEFNGVNIAIGDLGEVTITRKGPTKDDATLNADKVPEVQTGQTIVLDSTGGITIATHPDNSDNKLTQQYIKLDHAKKSLQVKADQAWSVDVVGATKITTGTTMTMVAQEDATLQSAKGGVVVSAPKGKILIGAGAKEAAVLGDTLVSLLKELCGLVAQITVPTGVGPSGPPVNTPAIKAFETKLQNCLSQAVKVTKGAS